MATKVQILDTATIERKLQRMAYEIVEQNFDAKHILLLGIVQNGLDIANILAIKIAAITTIKVTVSALNINKQQPTIAAVSTSLNIDNSTVIIVDDVANSGRTLLFAMAPIMHTIPAKIQIAVLVDRKHKSYPVQADYIGLTVSTTLQEHIMVEINNGVVAGAYLQ